jgi:hypothetical protein
MSGNPKLDRLNPYDLSSIAAVRKDVQSVEKRQTSPKPFSLGESIKRLPSSSDKRDGNNRK